MSIFVNAGIAIVTKENVDSYFEKDILKTTKDIVGSLETSIWRNNFPCDETLRSCFKSPDAGHPERSRRMTCHGSTPLTMTGIFILPTSKLFKQLLRV